VPRTALSDSPNVSVVRRLYQARGDPEVIRQVLASHVRWEVVDGFPYGAPSSLLAPWQTRTKSRP
jgi:hypothetical protein